MLVKKGAGPATYSVRLKLLASHAPRVGGCGLGPEHDCGATRQLAPFEARDGYAFFFPIPSHFLILSMSAIARLYAPRPSSRRPCGFPDVAFRGSAEDLRWKSPSGISTRSADSIDPVAAPRRVRTRGDSSTRPTSHARPRRLVSCFKKPPGSVIASGPSCPASS